MSAYRFFCASMSRIETALTEGTKQTSSWRSSTLAPNFFSVSARIP
ncbi:hypothetical protein [Streptomyces sp. NPDC048277]